MRAPLCFTMVILFGLIVPKVAGAAGEQEEDEYEEYDPRYCPSKTAELRANICIQKTAGFRPEELASLTYLLKTGSADLHEHEASRERLCRSLTPETTLAMRICRREAGCQPTLSCTVDQYRSLLEIGCTKDEIKNLCDRMFVS
ncbi:hypothetical protein DIPPA_32535 [Diplonema papillatum]|nr:hypothetical protein DIPPA_32535 [Diplonema papillatum]